jgi:hypothetical protein
MCAKKPSVSNRSSSPKDRKAKSTSPRARPAANSPAPQAPNAQESLDNLDLEAFCADIHFEDISFADWEQKHEELDLIVPVWVSAGEAQSGCERSVAFVRSIRRVGQEENVREKVELVVQIPGGSHNRTKILLAGKGEISGGKAGDLIVTIHIKSS